jgi:hypothetical protein
MFMIWIYLDMREIHADCHLGPFRPAWTSKSQPEDFFLGGIMGNREVNFRFKITFLGYDSH